MLAFFSSGPSQETLEEEQRAHTAWIRREYKRVVKPGREKILQAIQVIASQLANDLEQFKTLLRRVCFLYITMNAQNFFKAAGRQRAQAFSVEIDKTRCHADLIALLKAALRHGNFDDDSFKIVLYDMVITNFHEFKDTLSRGQLDVSWIALEKFFNILLKKVARFSNEPPCLIL